MKNFLKSLTMWGVALFGAVQALEGSGAIPIGTGGALTGLLEAVAGIMVIVGRFRATQPLTLGPDS